jgi:hypothetical protein
MYPTVDNSLKLHYLFSGLTLNSILLRLRWERN